MCLVCVMCSRSVLVLCHVVCLMDVVEDGLRPSSFLVLIRSYIIGEDLYELTTYYN